MVVANVVDTLGQAWTIGRAQPTEPVFRASEKGSRGGSPAVIVAAAVC